MLQGAPAPGGRAVQLLGGLPARSCRPAAGKVDQLVNPNSIYMKTYAAYLQDTWQVTRALTVSLGLRWEIYPLPTRPDGKGVYRFDPADGYVYVGGYGDVPQDTDASSGNGQLLPRAGRHLSPQRQDGVPRGLRPVGGLRRPSSTSATRTPSSTSGPCPPIKLQRRRQRLPPGDDAPAGAHPRPPAPPDLNQGKMLLPAGVGTTTYPKEADRGHIDSWNVTVQRELTSWMTVQAAYVGTRAIGQMDFVNINAGAPGTGDRRTRALRGGPDERAPRTSTCSSRTGTPPTTACRRSCASARANGQGGIAYTWSKTTNYADNGGGNAAGAGGPRIQYLPEKERNKGLAGYDRTHNFQAYWVWDLPFGKGQRWATSGSPSALLGGWQINGILSVMSGTPIYIVQNTGFNLNAAGSGAGARPGQGHGGDLSRQQGEHARRPAPTRTSTSTSTGAPTRRSTSRPASSSVSGPRPGTASAGRASGTSTSASSARSPAATTSTCSSASRRSTRSTTRTSRTPATTSPTPAPSGSSPSTTGVGERNIRLAVRVSF